MEQNPELEFEFFLALKLGRSVDELRVSLSAAEFVRWAVYFGRKTQREEIEQAKVRARR